jgi:hypothetical protein
MPQKEEYAELIRRRGVEAFYPKLSLPVGNMKKANCLFPTIICPFRGFSEAWFDVVSKGESEL